MQIVPQIRIKPVTTQRRRGENIASDKPDFSLEEKVQSASLQQHPQESPPKQERKNESAADENPAEDRLDEEEKGPRKHIDTLA